MVAATPEVLRISGSREAEAQAWSRVVALRDLPAVRARLIAIANELHRPVDAVPHLRALAEALPTDVKRWRRLARALRETNDAQSEAAAWLEVLSIEEDHEARLRLAHILPGLGRWKEGLPHLRACVEATPNDLVGWRRLARALSKLGDVEAEVDAWRRFCPSLKVGSRMNESLRCFTDSDYSVAAVPHVRALAESIPGEAKGWRRLARLLLRSGDPANEAMAWERLLALTNDLEAHARLAKLLPALGRTQDSLQHLRMLAEAAPEKAERWRRLAFFARVAGDLNGEIEAWQRILAIGADERAQSRLAELMQEIGQPLQAELLLRALAEAAPAEPARWKRLAFQLHEMGDAEGEAQVLQRVLKLTEDAEARERLCSLLPALGRAREALPHLQAHAEAAPGLADRWRRLAELSQQLGAEETEQLAWSRLVGLTGAPKAHARLSEILLKSGRSAEAVPHLRALAEAKPEKLSRWRQLAGALRQIEDVDGEIAAWEQMLQRAEDLGAHKRLSELFSAAGRVHEALPIFEPSPKRRPRGRICCGSWQPCRSKRGALRGR